MWSKVSQPEPWRPVNRLVSCERMAEEEEQEENRER